MTGGTARGTVPDVDVACPRCLAPLRAPGLFSSDWWCEAHGAVPPLHAPRSPSQRHLGAVLARTAVPAWLPWPLPTGWVLAGVSAAGDERAPAVAVVVALSGPSLVGGPADVLLVAEQPGVGLGAMLAGQPDPDPGPLVFEGVPSTKVVAVGHPTPLWEVDCPSDRAVYVGEASGCWLWAVVWPSEVVLELHDDVTLLDLRDPGHALDLPFGALSPRLPLGPAG